MTQPAAWYPDPTGTHQVRYWDGAAWTAHVADAGTASTAEVPEGAVLPPPAAAAPPVVEEPAWKDLLDKVSDSSKALADKARAAVAEATADRPGALVPPTAAQPAAAPAAAPDVAALAAQLRELGALLEDGLLTEEEFAAQKARLLGTTS